MAVLHTSCPHCLHPVYVDAPLDCLVIEQARDAITYGRQRARLWGMVIGAGLAVASTLIGGLLCRL